MNHKLFLVVLAMSLSYVSIAQVQSQPPQLVTPVQIVPLTQDQLNATGNNSRLNDLMTTPNSLRPIFVTDRGIPSPDTLGANFVAIDWSASYSYNDKTYPAMMADLVNQSFGIGLPMVRLGILKNVDLNFRPPSYEIKTSTYRSPFGTDFSRDSGFSDFGVGFKVNVQGNDDPVGFHWAVSGNVDLATASDHLVKHDNYRGGLSSELAYYSHCGWQARIDDGFTLSENDRGCWDCCFCNSCCLYSPEIKDIASIYGGLTTEVSTNDRQTWRASVITGMRFRFTPDFEAFAETGAGVNGDAPNFRIEGGFDLRLPNAW